ncbi:hypothetical protein [Sporosarcina obsidiansis]|uniref:hypothetical protein n=1 Tax=Sporosarcina obsidiansis TaxID=2660748 RepID=UPI00129B2435|nr:hypothetical protein [Sporosarcina obsidiansis]
MKYLLKDRSFEWSETAVAHEVFKLGETEGTLFEIEFTLTFSFGFLEYAHDFVWVNKDVETLLEQLHKIGGKKSGTLSALSPGLSFSYEQSEHERDVYFFSVFMDAGYMNSYMGTETGLSITLRTTWKEIKIWFASFIE